MAKQPGGKQKQNRRAFIKNTTAAAAAGVAGLAGGGYWLGSARRGSRAAGKKVIVIGVDGMDPKLTAQLMSEGRMPNFSKLSSGGGFSNLGTSTPPQSPVAWANFINGAGPGSHGIFDFVHRHPDREELSPFFSGADTVAGDAGWETGDFRLHLDFFPFNQKPPETVLQRKGVPFWDFLDAQSIPTTFYDLPSNYPPSPSQYGHHRCISGMGTPDLLGEYGTYQYLSTNGPHEPTFGQGSLWSRLVFDDATGTKAVAKIRGPEDGLLKEPHPLNVDLVVHRDKANGSAALEIQGQTILLKKGQWSPWTKINFELSAPKWMIPAPKASGICRFYLQSIEPEFQLYITPINIDPSNPVVKMSEPDSFITDVSDELGLFYTTGFQEDYNARKEGALADDEFATQAKMVLEERLRLFEYAVDNYDDGLLFFYFSSSDLQSHFFWWDSDDPHPIRSPTEARHWNTHIRQLYERLDEVVGEIYDKYNSQATIIVMSDHGFANFGMQFNLNSWLRYMGYLGPRESTRLDSDVDWSQTYAYGLGLNGLYLNLKGREAHGIVDPGETRDALLTQIAGQLEAITDYDGKKIIRGVYRSDQIYEGEATQFAPDLIIGYARGYRVSWASTIGEMTEEIVLPNDLSWSADHCADALEVPGVLVSNREIQVPDPTSAIPRLIDIAPSILAEFGVATPPTMQGRSIFKDRK